MPRVRSNAASYRMTFLERALLDVVRANHPHRTSYEGLAAHLECDRSTAIIMVKRMEHRGILDVDRGRGQVPNTYRLHEHMPKV